MGKSCCDLTGAEICSPDAVTLSLKSKDLPSVLTAESPLAAWAHRK